MRFLLDMGVSIRVAHWLRQEENDVTHLRDEGLQTLADQLIFQKALVENRTIVTFDLDFGEIAALSRGKVVSVVILRLSNARADYVVQRLDAVLPAVEPALLSGAIVTIEDTRHRIRLLPIQL
jgi:predicted nuclease of predicted toxin-antitoxin system